MVFVNQFGSINDDRQQALERSVVSDVRAYLNSLIAKGVSLADVRLSTHQLVTELHLVEIEVILEQQLKGSRVAKN